MEGSLKLVGYKFSPSVQIVLMAAKYANAPVTLENVNWGDPSREELKNKTPTGTFPYLETSEGILSESAAINNYLAEKYNQVMLGSKAFEKSQVRQWSDFAVHEIGRYTKTMVYPLFGIFEYNKAEVDKAFTEIKNTLKALEKHLDGKTYVVGSNITLADIQLFAALRGFFQFYFVEDLRKKVFPNLSKWFTNIATNENTLKTLGRTVLCKARATPPKVTIKTEEPKKEAKKETPQPAAAEKKEKKKNPLEELPPAKLPLDDFKRAFLNTNNKKAEMEKLWADFNPKDYSLWWMQYQKLPSEGKVLFKTNNSSSFFLQKLDHFRKYCFSVHGVYGEEGNYEIRGLWMWRGSEIPEEIREHDNFEYMTIKQLDPSKETDRKLTEDYWLKTNPAEVVDGMPVAEVVYFK